MTWRKVSPISFICGNCGSSTDQEGNHRAPTSRRGYCEKRNPMSREDFQKEMNDIASQAADVQQNPPT